MEVIREAIPEYFSTIRPRIEIIKEEIVNKRAQKDIGSITDDNFMDYVELINELKRYLKRIKTAQISMLEIREKAIKRNLRRILIDVLIAIVAALIGILIKTLLK